MLGELGCEEFRHWAGQAGRDVCFECGARITWRQKPLGQGVSIGARSLPDNNPVGKPAHILNKDNPQGDGDRPKLANRQRLNALIGDEVTAQNLGVEMAICVSDVSPGEPEDAWVASKRAIGQFRQLPIIARRQIIANFANLLFDKMVVVEQPFGSMDHATAAFHLCRCRPVGCQQECGVLIEAGPQRKNPRRGRRYALRRR